MNLFKPGNVIKHLHSNTLCAVISCSETIVEVIFFNSENCSGHFLLEDKVETLTCCCNYDFANDYNSDNSYSGEYQEDCSKCHGTGKYQKNSGGWKNAELISSTIQSYITKHVLGTMFPELTV